MSLHIIRRTKPSSSLRAGTSAPAELLSIREAADYARVSVSTVRRWIRTSQLRSYRAGIQIRICRDDLIKFLRGEQEEYQLLLPD